MGWFFFDFPFSLFFSFFFLAGSVARGPLYRPVAFVVAQAGRMALK